MKAMVLNKPHTPLEWTELPDRSRARRNQSEGPRLRRLPHRPACGRRRVAGRQIADHPRPRDRRPDRCDRGGRHGLAVGERVGIPWLGHAYGVCPYCRGTGKTSAILRCSPATRATAATRRRSIADARFAFPLGETGSDVVARALLCAGLIGWRSLKIAGEGKRLGIYGFGAAGHIVAQVAKWRAGRCSPSPGPATSEPRLSPEAWASPGRAGRMRRRPSRWTRRSSMRPWAIWSPGAQSGPQGRARGLRRNPHERHPELSLRDPVGRAAALSVANLTRQDGIEFLALAPEDGHRRQDDDLSASARPTRRWPTCGPAGSTAPRC